MNWLKRIFPMAVASTALLAAPVVFAQDAPTPAPAPAAADNGARTDSQIEMDVVHALDASKALKDDMITAATIQGEVTLSGTSGSEASRELAEQIASHVNGVSAVKNNLQVGNPQAADNAPAAAEPNAKQMADDADMTPPAAQPAQPAYDNTAPVASADPAPAQPARPAYVPAVPPPPSAPPAPMYAEAHGPVTIPTGTLLQVRTAEAVISKNAKEGTPVQFTVIRDVVYGGVLAIPRGATVHGVVAASKQAGTISGSPELSLQLTSLDLGGKTYAMDSDLFKVKGPSKTGQTVRNASTGAIFGAIIGAAAGRGTGAAIGAVAGAGVGTAASAASNPNAWIPSEALVDFHLNAPLTVTPVDAREAARLAQGLYPGGPQLYRRSAPYPYGGTVYVEYPPVYYHPYYIVGGSYYWR